MLKFYIFKCPEMFKKSPLSKFMNLWQISFSYLVQRIRLIIATIFNPNYALEKNNLFLCLLTCHCGLSTVVCGRKIALNHLIVSYFFLMLIFWFKSPYSQIPSSSNILKQNVYKIATLNGNLILFLPYKLVFLTIKMK